MKNYPLVKIVFLFISGIIIQKYLLLSPATYFITILIFTVILFTIIKLKWNKKFEVAISIFIYLIFILLGGFVSEVNKQDEILLSPKIYNYKNLKAYGTISNIELIREKEIIFNLDED